MNLGNNYHNQNPPFKESYFDENDSDNILLLDDDELDDVFIQNQQTSNDKQKTNSVLNNQHCTNRATFENKVNFTDFKDKCANSSFRPSHKGQKQKIDLPNKTQRFQEDFYLAFTNKKRFPKLLVKKIHQLIAADLGLAKFTRSMERVIATYFISFSQYSDKILSYIVSHKKDIINQVPELKNYQ